ncbi:MAG: phospholipase D family protein [Elusimicrobia bacterium]|nr:phospholipase D family protein [Elusimicrobiota bacterium]
MRSLALAALLAVPLGAAAPAGEAPDPAFWGGFERLLAAHPGRNGVYAFEKGEESLLARAWLSSQATRSIDAQYFIWSADNIGILAAQRLLRAAENGAKVRVIVDDFLLDAGSDSLLALAAHPGVEIRVYNPKYNAGVSRARRYWNLATGFRDANQRMHDKVFLVDGRIAIVGGRNVADEYFDYDHEYNFRDRDLLLMGPETRAVKSHFEAFWASPLSVPIETLLKDEVAAMTPERRDAAYRDLHRYAADPANLAPGPRRALQELPSRFAVLLGALAWEKEATFIGDRPGKNESKGLAGGGGSTSALAAAVAGARERVVIQSPYLVLSEEGLAFFAALAERVEVRIVTNSFASTDNLAAFSGYRKIRARLLASGVKVFEFKPHPAVERDMIERRAEFGAKPPVFAIHAKTVVIDGEAVFVGTFNLDPRSANLNTEVGVLVRGKTLAGRVEASILRDMLPENSWDAASGEGDAGAPLKKRLHLLLLRALPLQPIL